MRHKEVIPRLSKDKFGETIDGYQLLCGVGCLLDC